MPLCSQLVFGFDETQLFNPENGNSNNNNINNKNQEDTGGANDRSVPTAAAAISAVRNTNTTTTKAMAKNMNNLASKFKTVFQNITQLVSCVKCHKCRLHGKIAIHGIGAALKILLTPIPSPPPPPPPPPLSAIITKPTTAGESLAVTDNQNIMNETQLAQQRHDFLKSVITRDDIVALVNILHKFSNALRYSDDTFSLFNPSTVIEATAVAATTTTTTKKIVTTATTSKSDVIAAATAADHDVTSSLASKSKPSVNDAAAAAAAAVTTTSPRVAFIPLFPLASSSTSSLSSGDATNAPTTVHISSYNTTKSSSSSVPPLFTSSLPSEEEPELLAFALQAVADSASQLVITRFEADLLIDKLLFSSKPTGSSSRSSDSNSINCRSRKSLLLLAKYFHHQQESFVHHALRMLRKEQSTSAMSPYLSYDVAVVGGGKYCC